MKKQFIIAGAVIVTLVVAMVAGLTHPAKRESLGAVADDSRQIFIQYRFKEKTPVGDFADNILLRPVEPLATQILDFLNHQDIEGEISRRVQDHVDSIKNAPPPKEPTVEELQAQADALQAQLDQVQQQIDEATP